MVTDTIKFYKTVVSLPDTLEANTMYAVRVGEGFDFYISDLTGSIAYKTNPVESEKTVTLYQDGFLVPTVGTTRWYNPKNININTITARLAQSSENTVSIRIKKSDTQVLIVSFNSNQNKVTESVDIDMLIDDYLTVDVLTSGGQGLSVQFTYSFN
jgi:hypothetical protein